MSRPVASAIWAWLAISLPWSQVRVRRRKAGRSAIAVVIAVAIVGAVWSPGRCSSITNRVLRSTRVPIAGVARAHDQVALPVSRYGTVGDLGGPLADHHHVLDPAQLAASSTPD